MRRLIPLFLVGVLTALAVGAALVGWNETTPSTSSFIGSSEARATLDNAVRRTLDVQSLTMNLGNNWTVVYQAPNLTHETTSFEDVIRIGSRTLTKSFGEWFEGLPGAASSQPLASSISPRDRLSKLLKLSDVEEQGPHTFVSERLVHSAGRPHNPVTVIETVQVVGGFVSSDRLTVRGHEPPVRIATCGNCQSESFFETDPGATTFTGFDSSHVVIPPRSEIVERTTVATRKIGHVRLEVYTWPPVGSPYGTTTGFSLFNRSGQPIDGGSGGPTGALGFPGNDLLPDGGGSSGPGSWSDVTVSVSGPAISSVRLLSDGKTLDAMAPAAIASGRFVVLVAKQPKDDAVSIEGLDASGHVVASTPYSW